MNKTKKIKHAVILINYADAKTTASCVSSIKKTKDTPYIIVVDNGSSVECIAELKELCPEIDLIQSPTNLGFSAANNLGIKKALRMGAEVVYILNNDTLVDPNLFFRSYRFVAKKNRIAGAKIYYAKGYEYHESQKGQGNILWYAGGYYDDKVVISRHIGIDEEDRGQFDHTQNVDFITGCFMAIPRLVFKKIGLFNEDYFLYLEDTEYSLRAKNNKTELIYNPNLVLYHLNGGSTSAGSALVDYYMTRNRFYIARHFGSWRLRLALSKEALLRNWTNPIRRRAYLDYLFGRMGNQNDVINKLKSKI